MSQRIATALTTLAVAGLLTACSSPSSPSGQASVTAPRQVTPAPNATVRNAEQPITLTVANAIVTQAATATYTFEVATDANFTNKVQTKDNVAAGASGQTSVVLDRLTPATDYYWHVRATGGGTTGVYGPAYKFTVGPQVTLAVPAVVAPASGAQTDGKPTFTVANAARTGPAGNVTYRFEVAANAAFNPLLVDQTVPEGTTRTTFTATNYLPAETTIYWRVTAIDQSNAVNSGASPAQSFVTALSIDLSRVTYLQSPDISQWRETGRLEIVEQDGANDGPLCMRFTEPGWPDWPFFGDPNFGVYANMWFFAKINGQWYGGAGEWLYRGGSSCKIGQGTRTMGPDSGFGPPVNTWAPRVGELVGWMVTAAARRGARTVEERTQVVVQPWRDTSQGSTFAPRTLR